MKAQPIHTTVGEIWGRDALYLRYLKWNYDKENVVLTGCINTNQCEGYKGDKSTLYFEIAFQLVLDFQMTELDHYDFGEINSCIDEIVDSERINYFKGIRSQKIHPEHKHYRIATYDDIFDVVAKKIEIRIDIPEKERLSFAETLLEKYRKGQKKFRDIELENEDLQYKDLQGITFENCFLSVDFTGSDLQNASFLNSNIKTCIFEGANLTNTHFENCAMDGVNFNYAITNGIVLKNNYVFGTIINQSDFEEFLKNRQNE